MGLQLPPPLPVWRLASLRPLCSCLLPLSLHLPSPQTSIRSKQASLTFNFLLSVRSSFVQTAPLFFPSLFAVMNRQMDASLDIQDGWLNGWMREAPAWFLSACQPPWLCWTTRSGVLVCPGPDVSRSSRQRRVPPTPPEKRDGGRMPPGVIVMRISWR